MSSTGKNANAPGLFILTSVNLDELAASPAVSAFMARVADEFRDPLSGELLAASLAEATANVFELHSSDSFGIPAKLYELAFALAKRAR